MAYSKFKNAKHALSYPFFGTGVPHLRSLVMHLCWSPPFSHDLAITLALFVQPSEDLFSHPSSLSST